MSLRATDVSVAFDGEPVLRGVSAAATPGEVFTVVGPSGTGKTTLLRLLAAFRPPDDGSLHWGDRDLWALPAEKRLTVRRRLAMVFQEPTLFNASVRRNVVYGLRVRRSWAERLRTGARGLVGDPSLPDAVAKALETVGLAGTADRNALSLSGGEAQRIAFARAMAVEPEVLLLDEPTSDLDPRNTAVIEDAVGRARDRGMAVVVASHDMHQAERLSDRVGFLFGGELVETGHPEQLFEAPTDPRTERFLNGELIYDGDATRGRVEGS